MLAMIRNEDTDIFLIFICLISSKLYIWTTIFIIRLLDRGSVNKVRNHFYFSLILVVTIKKKFKEPDPR